MAATQGFNDTVVGGGEDPNGEDPDEEELLPPHAIEASERRDEATGELSTHWAIEKHSTYQRADDMLADCFLGKFCQSCPLLVAPAAHRGQAPDVICLSGHLARR